MPELSEALQYFSGMNILTLVFLTAGATVILNNRTVERLPRRVFLDSLMALFLIVLIDWLTHITSGSYPELRYVHTVLLAITFALAPCIPVAIADAIFPAEHVKWIRILLVVHAVIQVGSIFGGYIFWIDESNEYHRGPLYAIYMLVYIIALLYLVVESVRMGRAFHSSILAIVMVLACLLVGVFMQVFNSSIRTTWPAVAMTVVLFFVYYSDMVLRAEPLTKLLNRRSFEEYIEDPKLPCVVVIIDVDNFKRVNDTHGHVYGDECLVKIAGLIRRSFGLAALCYRTGGDEFAVFITMRLSDAETLIGAFKDAVARVQKDDPRLPNVSVGYAIADSDCTNIETVIDAADKAMYEAKNRAKQERGLAY